MTRDEAVQVAKDAGRDNLVEHIAGLHAEIEELHQKHGTKRGEHVHAPHPASWGHADADQRGLTAAEAEQERSELAAQGLNHRGVPLTTGKTAALVAEIPVYSTPPWWHAAPTEPAAPANSGEAPVAGAPSGDVEAGAPEVPEGLKAIIAAQGPALVLDHDPDLDDELPASELASLQWPGEFDDSDGFEGDDEDTAPEGAALSSATKPDHPDAPKPKAKSHKKGGR